MYTTEHCCLYQMKLTIKIYLCRKYALTSQWNMKFRYFPVSAVYREMKSLKFLYGLEFTIRLPPQYHIFSLLQHIFFFICSEWLVVRARGKVRSRVRVKC